MVPENAVDRLRLAAQLRDSRRRWARHWRRCEVCGANQAQGRGLCSTGRELLYASQAIGAIVSRQRH